MTKSFRIELLLNKIPFKYNQFIYLIKIYSELDTFLLFLFEI